MQFFNYLYLLYLYLLYFCESVKSHTVVLIYVQIQLYMNYYSVSLRWSLHTGSTVHQLLQCVPWVVFTHRFYCIYTSTTIVCPLGGLYIQVPLYINYYSVSLGWSLYTGSTVHQLLQCVPWVVFIYRLHYMLKIIVCLLHWWSL